MLTPKLKTNRQWMIGQVGQKITITKLLKEKNKPQLRVKKQEKDKKQKSTERHKANKWFDKKEARFYDHCKCRARK